jgi:(S)-3,5-dihydroxyphenylglycine transaminase
VVADQQVAGEDGSVTLFADELSKIKSMITLNTSAIAQAVVGGKLLAHGGSLIKATVREREVYVRNMRMIVNGLAARFPRKAGGSAPVTWTVPAGGFFVVVTVPFVVDDALLERSARDYGVLWTPMRHFYQTGEDVRSLRLSCSSVTPEQIDAGLDRLAALISQELDRHSGDWS